jgi:hypothetical protein
MCDRYGRVLKCKQSMARTNFRSPKKIHFSKQNKKVFLFGKNGKITYSTANMRKVQNLPRSLFLEIENPQIEGLKFPQLGEVCR